MVSPTAVEVMFGCSLLLRILEGLGFRALVPPRMVGLRVVYYKKNISFAIRSHRSLFNRDLRMNKGA